MMSASPGAEDSFEMMLAGDAKTHDDYPERFEIESKTRQQTDFNFSSLWRKPKLSRRLLGNSTDHMAHVKLDSPMVSEKESVDMPRKKSKSRKVKDRESFETMGSPHLSELDESRDVVPVVMKREGWNFIRELPNGYDESSGRSSSAKMRKDMNPQIFLTPSPAKLHVTRSSYQEPARGHTTDDQDSDGVFTLIRSNGYKSRLSSHSRQSNINLQDLDIQPTPPLNLTHKRDDGTWSSGEALPDFEVYDGDYLNGEAILSSISDDSGNSRQNQRKTCTSSIDKSNNVDNSDSALGNQCVTGNSFSARMRFFQAKATENSNKKTRNFQRNQLQTQTTASTAETTSSTRDNSKNDEGGLVYTPMMREKNSSTRCKRSGSVNLAGPHHGVYLESATDDVKKIIVARLASPGDARDSKIASTTPSPRRSFGYSQEVSAQFSVHESAGRFGVVLGQRHNSNVKDAIQNHGGSRNSRTHGMSSRLKGMKRPSTSQHEKEDPSRDLSGMSKSRLSTAQSQPPLVGPGVVSISPTMSPKKQSKSMSVLERSKLFERKNANLSSRRHSVQPSQGTPEPCTTGVSSSLVFTCDKCGSAVKAPVFERELVKKADEKGIRQKIKSLSCEEESDVEVEEPCENAGVSDDDSTVVGDRRLTLKSAPRDRMVADLTRALTKSLHTIGVGAVSESNGLKLDTKNNQSLPFMERLKTFNGHNKHSNEIDKFRTKVLKKPIFPKNGTEPSKVQQKNTVPDGENIDNQMSESKDDHPSFVAIDDDFFVKDDTSGFYSTSENSRQVVCQPTDYTPYYVKKNQTSVGDQYEDSSVESLQKSISRWKRRYDVEHENLFESERMKGYALKATIVSRGETPVDKPVTYGSGKQMISKSKKESTKENAGYTRNQSQPEYKARTVSGIYDRRQTGSKNISSAISNRLAVFQQSSKYSKKWKASPEAATSKKSAERWSYSEKRQSSRKSSLSLQDIVDSRQEMEERRKSSLGGTREGSLCSETIIEVDENVRPSDLFKKISMNVEPAPPSPLIYRRGFTATAGRSSSGFATKTKNLRCF